LAKRNTADDHDWPIDCRAVDYELDAEIECPLPGSGEVGGCGRPADHDVGSDGGGGGAVAPHRGDVERELRFAGRA
jgi:hypothetical protein